MAEKKLSFAIFGNASKAFDSLQITEILDYLREHEADVYWHTCIRLAADW